MDAKIIIAIVIGTLFFLMFAGFMLAPSSSNSRSNSYSYGSYRSSSCSSGCMRGGSGGKLLLFHTSWCGYCQQFLPTWEKLAEKHGNVMQDLLCDDGQTENQKKSREYGVNGFPTIIYVDGQGNHKVYDKPSRSEENVTEFMKENGLI